MSALAEAQRIAANLEAFANGCEYSVLNALRDAARKTVTRTKRTIRKDVPIPLKLLKRRVAWFPKRQRLMASEAGYRVWMGNDSPISGNRHKAAREYVIRHGAVPGRYHTADGKPKLIKRHRGVYESAGIYLEDWHQQLEEHGRTAFATDFPIKLRANLRAKVKRTKDRRQARLYAEHLSRLTKALKREGVSIDGNL